MSWRALPPALTRTSRGALFKACATPLTSADALAGLHAIVSARCGTTHTIGVDSGTSALRLALSLSGSSDSIVALPAFGCFDLLTATVGANRRALYYDLDPQSLSPDLTALERVLQQGATLVVVASLFGYASPMPQLAALCATYGAVLIEDIAQAFGATLDHRPLGAWGDMVTMSFGRGKGIGGAGGGALLIRDGTSASLDLPTASTRVAVKGALGLVAQQVMAHPVVFPIPSAMPWLRLGETVYHDPWPPFMAHPVQLMLAADALTHESGEQRARAAVAARISTVIESNSGQLRPIKLTTIEPSSAPGYLRLGARGAPQFMNALRWFGARPSYPMALVDHPNAAHATHAVPSVPGARELAERLWTLPTHHWVTDADLHRLSQLCRTVAAT